MAQIPRGRSGTLYRAARVPVESAPFVAQRLLRRLPPTAFETTMPTQTSPILDVTTLSFPQEVVERSMTVPVMVDLWATWCGPCKSLSPVLEKLAREMNGRFVLAKVDIDQNPELAEAFGVQSVPMVVIVSGGRIVDEFVGAKPEAQIRTMLEKHLGAAPVDAIEEALALEKSGDLQAAITGLNAHLRERPDRHDARAHLARLQLLSGLVDEGRQTFESIPAAARETEAARAAQALLDLQKNRVDTAPLRAAIEKNPGDLAARLALGRALVAENKPEEGLEMLLSAAKLDLGFDGGAPRKALIETFDVLGEANPLVTRYRRALSMLLCV